jgi:hypothetical protein
VCNLMRLARFTSGCFVLLLMLTAEISSREPAATRLSHMAFGDIVEMDGVFVAIRGELGPASFFRGLRSVERKDRTVVLNGQGEVQFFPDRFTITLFLLGPLAKGHEKTPTRFDQQYMEDLQFKAEWKRGLDLRLVKRFTLLTASAARNPGFDPLFLSFQRESWIYEFVVEDSDVPIEDHLILYIISPENKRLARLSAHL